MLLYVNTLIFTQFIRRIRIFKSTVQPQSFEHNTQVPPATATRPGGGLQAGCQLDWWIVDASREMVKFIALLFPSLFWENTQIPSDIAETLLFMTAFWILVLAPTILSSHFTLNLVAQLKVGSFGQCW